jgi:transcriptional regulator with XRE-family HTH domain
VPSPYREENLSLVKLLVTERTKRGILQKDLAAALGKPQSFIAKVEGSERRLDVAEFLDYVFALGADPVKIIRQLLKQRNASVTKGD